MREAEAIAMFCYQVKKCIGAFAAALGELGTLVLAGGIVIRTNEELMIASTVYRVLGLTI